MHNSSRRQFLEKSTAAIAAGTLMNTFTDTQAEAATHKGETPFVHHVFFNDECQIHRRSAVRDERDIYVGDGRKYFRRQAR